MRASTECDDSEWPELLGHVMGHSYTTFPRDYEVNLSSCSFSGSVEV